MRESVCVVNVQTDASDTRGRTVELLPGTLGIAEVPALGYILLVVSVCQKHLSMRIGMVLSCLGFISVSSMRLGEVAHLISPLMAALGPFLDFTVSFSGA